MEKFRIGGRSGHMDQHQFDTLSVTENGEKKTYKIRLRVMSRETEETRYCRLSEAKTWDWDNQEIWRMIGGWQITSYQKLLSMLVQKAQKGQEEVELLESPRFMMLSGG